MQGIANLVGVTWLSSLLADAAIQTALANSSLAFVGSIMPGLQVCLAAASRSEGPSTPDQMPEVRMCRVHSDQRCYVKSSYTTLAFLQLAFLQLFQMVLCVIDATNEI